MHLDAQTIFIAITVMLLAYFLIIKCLAVIGVACNKAKRYRLAAACFSCLIFLHQQRVVAYINRSLAYLNLKEFEKAKKDCDRAIKLKPNVAMAYNNRSAAQLKLKQYEQGLQDAQRAIQLKPDLKQAQRNRAYAYTLLRDYEQALLYYNRTILIDPENPNHYHIRAYIYLHLNQFEPARADFIKSWQLNPKDMNYAWMVEWCGMCVEQPGPETAERLTTIASLMQASLKESPYLCRATAFWLQERFTEALQELEQALAIAPDNEDTCFWIGMTYATLGRDIEAKAALERAIVLNLSRILLRPLFLLEHKYPAFFQHYAQPLLIGNTLNAVESI